MKILNRIITFVTTVFVIIACIVFAATAICKIGNIEPRIVLSGSMEPKIHTGSICFINKKVPYDKIKTGDIIAFKAGKNTMVTHRVISVTNSGFETKGDLIAIGSFCLCIIAIIPFIVSGLTGLSRLSFFGTSIIITVSVILETKKLILSKTQENYYMNRVKKGGLFRG